MRKMLPALFLVAGFLCVAQTTAPATQPTTQPTCKNPDVEALIAKYPVEIIEENDAIVNSSPKLDAEGRNMNTDQKAIQEKIIAHGANVKAWSKANADGKTLAATVIRGDATHADCCYIEGSGARFTLNVQPKKLIENIQVGQQFTVRGVVGVGGFGMARKKDESSATFYLTLQKCELVK